MNQRLHIIYLPGFGDNYDTGRRFLLWCWRIFGITTEFVPMCWDSNESYKEKHARVNDAIDRAKKKRVVIIGESAGGSMAVAIYAQRYNDLFKVMTICGKNSNPASVAPRLYLKHPAFRESMRATESSLKKIDSNMLHRFVPFYPLYDGVIPYDEAVIPGCKVVRLFSSGHFFTIFLALTIYSSYLVFVANRRN